MCRARSGKDQALRLKTLGLTVYKEGRRPQVKAWLSVVQEGELRVEISLDTAALSECVPSPGLSPGVSCYLAIFQVLKDSILFKYRIVFRKDSINSLPLHCFRQKCRYKNTDRYVYTF